MRIKSGNLSQHPASYFPGHHLNPKLWRVEGGAGGGGADPPKLAVDPVGEVVELAPLAQAVRHGLLLRVQVLG